MGETKANIRYINVCFSLLCFVSLTRLTNKYLLMLCTSICLSTIRSCIQKLTYLDLDPSTLVYFYKLIFAFLHCVRCYRLIFIYLKSSLTNFNFSCDQFIGIDHLILWRSFFWLDIEFINGSMDQQRHTLITKIRPILYFYVDKYRNKKVHDYDKLDILYAFSIFEILFKSINIVVAN